MVNLLADINFAIDNVTIGAGTAMGVSLAIIKLVKFFRDKKAAKAGDTDIVEDEPWDKDEDRCKRDPISQMAALELQSQIQGYIEHILHSIEGADRVVIHKFHNGGKYHTGVSTQKMRLVYEASLPGYMMNNEIAGESFNLEKMGGILKKIVDNRYLFLKMEEDKDVLGFTPYFQILREEGVAANHLSILRSGGEWRNIGMLSIHFIKDKKHSLTEKEKMIITKARRDISLLLVGDTKGYPKNHI